ncbi:MAG: ATP-binding cassette domain-containing protein [Lewinellaceae bacterium]|nr:ATP-binding cassette domain-containing protein [Lewinellaceae bacterium]
MNAIEAHNLTYRFPKGDPVLNQIDLRVPTGSIYGFLGPNGAGKTTTLRLLLGLLRKQQGEIRVFDQSFSSRTRISLLHRIGSLIEMPSVYSHLSATDNLRIWQKVYQCPEKRVGEVLELVGLAGTGAKKAGKFSLGMKQRLGIAAALLHTPDLLVLDEPTNGLDPSGIIEIRELLKKLNRESGITILISSHLLAEIEKLVTDIGIINKGNMLFEGPLNELKLRRQQAASVAFETSDNQRALNLIREAHPESRVVSDKLLLPALPREAVAAINRKLVEDGIDVFGITTPESDLETIFMHLTK